MVSILLTSTETIHLKELVGGSLSTVSDKLHPISIFVFRILVEIRVICYAI